MSSHIQAIEDFSEQADELRSHFLERFENPLEAAEGRFVWDYWHVPDQYTLLRTPAYHFFPEEMYNKLEQELLAFGQQELGCSQISPPWLSYYIDGCGQQLHTDNPHGPWAFVFSLTDWANREFSGGETQVMKPEILNFWSHHTPGSSIELEGMYDEIDPEFNQLTVFDPRYPHGVKPVGGSHDPRDSRLVVHGWFTEPCLFITGELDPDDTLESLNPQMGNLLEELGKWDETLTGIITTRLDVSPTGEINEVTLLTNTAYDLRGKQSERVSHFLTDKLNKFKLPESDGDSEVTIPFIFE